VGAALTQRIKLSVLLPVLQVSVTGILTFWADRVAWMFFGDSSRTPGPYVLLHLIVFTLRPVWTGINAPTYPFCDLSGQPIPWLLGFGFGEILYLCAVGILWYLVGRFLDGRRGLNENRRSAHSIRAALLVATWGIVLLVVSVSAIAGSLHLVETESVLANLRLLLRARLETVLTHLLFVLWSAILILSPAVKVAQTLWPKFATSR
jgi:hypothetical protein